MAVNVLITSHLRYLIKYLVVFMTVLHTYFYTGYNARIFQDLLLIYKLNSIFPVYINVHYYSIRHVAESILRS